jgi:ferritin-like metal-binding protein YciE
MVFGKKKQHIDNLNDLYSQQLQEQYSVENEYLGLLADLNETASLANLKEALVEERRRTEQHRETIERICRRRNLDPEGHSSKGMKALTKSVGDAIAVDGEPAVRDLVIMTLLRRVKQFEGSGFEMLRTYADKLGFDEDARDHQKMVEEENVAAAQLADVADNKILKGLKTYD